MKDQDFRAFRVSVLRGDQKIPFDAYVRVDGKYILFCREGDSFEGDRLNRLRSKKLQKMYLKKEQAHLYDKYITENISKAYDLNRDVALEQRVLIIQGAIQAATEDLLEEIDNEAHGRVAEEASKRFRSFLASNPPALKLLLEIPNQDFNVAQHGVTVAGLALQLAEQMGHAESKALQMPAFSIGCLVHDIEHHFTPVTLTVPTDKLSSNERRLYNQHSLAGYERVKDILHLDPLIKEIVQYHDEKIDGSGYYKKKEKDINPLVFVAGTANAFDQIRIREKLNPKEAIKKIMIDKMGVLPLECLKALQEVLKKSKVL